MNRNDKTDAFKNRLAKSLAEMMLATGWKRREMAYRLDLCESAVSNILNGKTKKFKVDWLINIMFNLGYNVEIKFTRVEP